jgi:MFS family permease
MATTQKAPKSPRTLETASIQDATGLRWYQGISKYGWMVLLICALGWMFDCFDQQLFNLVRQPSVTDLLRGSVSPAELDATAKLIGGYLTAVFLVGWAAGGFLFGSLGDKWGRTRTMMITILIYAIFTGLNGLVTNIEQYYFCRFMTALGVGGEFAAGASLVAEVWPQRSRAMSLGLLQALSAVGNMAAGVTCMVLSQFHAEWRTVFFIGAVPALMVLWVRRTVHEPESWHQAKADAAASGAAVGSIPALFTDPVLRRNTIAGVLLAAAGVGGVWGVGFWSPDLIASTFKPVMAHAPDIAAIADPKMQADAIKAAVGHWKGLVYLIQMLGAGLGMFAFAGVTEKIGRRPALALFFALAFVSLQVFFHFVKDPTTAFILAFVMGFCTLGPFAAFAIYFPELFPTRLRTTGVSFCYNSARILAALAPIKLGQLSKAFASPTDESAGLRVAASIVACIYILGFIGLAFAPETKGKPLPE